MTALTTETSWAPPAPSAAPTVPVRTAAPIVPAPGPDYRADLLAQHTAACVWGLGHIGWSTVEALRAEGVAVVGYDIDPARAEERRAVASGPAGPAAQVTSDRARALADDVAVHFVAVPTEREAEPFAGALVEVFAAIVADTAARRPGRPPLVIVESTLTPGTVEDLLLPSSPRPVSNPTPTCCLPWPRAATGSSPRGTACATSTGSTAASRRAPPTPPVTCWA